MSETITIILIPKTMEDLKISVASSVESFGQLAQYILKSCGPGYCTN